jgi:hypothetical protein
MNHFLIQQLYAGIAPWAALSLLLIGRNPRPGPSRKTAAVLLAALILTVIPINGWNVASWSRVLEPNPSLTLTGLLVVALASRLLGKPLFRREDWTSAWVFGAAAALILYPMGLGLTNLDPYAWGWNPELPLSVAVAATLLLLLGNRFGVVLILPFAAFPSGVQESTNFWDALIDPFYGGISLIVVLLTQAVPGKRPVGDGGAVIPR